MAVSPMSVRGSIPEIIRNDEGLYAGDLRHYFKIVFKHARNLHNPYHNFRHMFHVLWLCYQACLYYRDVLSPDSMRWLLKAAMFHDYDHSGISEPDSAQIERAIAGLYKHAAPGDRGHILNSAILIGASEFPHVPFSELHLSPELELCAQILRDADLSQAFSVAWIQQVIIGLAREWGKTPTELLQMQEKFLGSLRFFTAWAQEMFPQAEIDAKIQEALEILALLEE